MRFKTTEWTIAAAAAAHELKRAGFRGLAANIEDMAKWMLLHIEELEAIGVPKPAAQKDSPRKPK